MKKIWLLLLVFVAVTRVVSAQEINLEGIYQGKNLYVMNPFASGGVGYCVYEVKVNGQVTTDEINSNAFEIDLSAYSFKIGDKIKIEVKHKANCTPKILNPEVLQARSTFNVTAIKVGKDKQLTWTATEESGSLTFVVEQFRWNKWVKVAEVQGKGNPGANSYSVEVYPNSGENQFRVKQTDYTKKPRYSRIAKYRSMDPPVTYAPLKKILNEITFSSETMYEVYNPFGNLILKGYGSRIDISGLKKLDKYKYILYFDNQMIEFNKDK